MSVVDYRRDAAIGHLVLSNPGKLNVLNPEMLAGIGAALDAFLGDEQARVLIVRGEGTSFCAGVDVGAGSRYGAQAPPQDHERLYGTAALWLRFWDSPKPVIAQVHGYCLAGAVQFPLSCDLMVVADSAVIGSPKLPMGAGWIGPMLAHRMGVQRAKLFAFQLGFEMSGQEAYDWGLAAVVASAAELAGVTEDLARRISATPPELLRMEKLSINAVAEAAGFRMASYGGTVWDALAHTSDSVHDAKDLVRSVGVKDAIAHYKKSATDGT